MAGSGTSRLEQQQQEQERPSPPSPFADSLEAVTSAARDTRRVNGSTTEDEAIYLSYATVLDFHLACPESRTPRERIALLTAVADTINMLGNGKGNVATDAHIEPKEEVAYVGRMLQCVAWDIVKTVLPYTRLRECHGIALRILETAALYGNSREVFITAAESLARLSDAIFDVGPLPEEIMEASAAVSILSKAIRRIQTSKPSKFVGPAVRNALKILQGLAKGSRIPGKDMYFDEAYKHLIRSTKELLDCCAGKWKDMHPPPPLYYHSRASPDRLELIRQRRIATHLVLELSYLVAPIPSTEDMSGRRLLNAFPADELVTEEALDALRMSAIDHRLNIVELLGAYAAHGDADLADEEAEEEFPCFEPCTILALWWTAIATRILENHAIRACAAAFDPPVTDHRWLLRTLVPVVLATTENAPSLTEEHARRVKFSLAVLRRVIERVDRQKAAGREGALLDVVFSWEDVCDGDDKEQEGDAVDWEPIRGRKRRGCRLGQLIQSLSVFASTSADPMMRYAAFRAVGDLLYFCACEARAIVLVELLSSCPFPNMRSESIVLLKEAVEEGFCAAANRPQGREASLFASAILREKFFPLLFTAPPAPDQAVDGDLLDEFFENYSRFMHATNFLVYLLGRDKALNLTGIWDRTCVAQIDKEYLGPLKAWVRTARTSIGTTTMKYDADDIGRRSRLLDLLENAISRAEEASLS